MTTYRHPIAQSIQAIGQDASTLAYWIGGSDTCPQVPAEYAVFGEIMDELGRIARELWALAAKVPSEISPPYAARLKYLGVPEVAPVTREELARYAAYGPHAGLHDNPPGSEKQYAIVAQRQAIFDEVMTGVGPAFDFYLHRFRCEVDDNADPA